MKRMIGYGILAAMFAGYFGVHIAAYGLKASAIVFGITAVIVGLVVLAAFLIASED
jgi:uncharacterized membrane protein